MKRRMPVTILGTPIKNLEGVVRAARSRLYKREIFSKRPIICDPRMPKRHPAGVMATIKFVYKKRAYSVDFFRANKKKQWEVEEVTESW